MTQTHIIIDTADIDDEEGKYIYINIYIYNINIYLFFNMITYFYRHKMKYNK